MDLWACCPPCPQCVLGHGVPWEAALQGRVGWIPSRLSSVPAFLGEPLASCHAEGGGGRGPPGLALQALWCSMGVSSRVRALLATDGPEGAALSGVPALQQHTCSLCLSQGRVCVLFICVGAHWGAPHPQLGPHITHGLCSGHFHLGSGHPVTGHIFPLHPQPLQSEAALNPGILGQGQCSLPSHVSCSLQV